jgi:hypothetical protein
MTSGSEVPMDRNKNQRAPAHVKRGPVRSWRDADAFRQAAFAFALIVAVVAVLALVAVSPLALRELSMLRGMDWAKLSDIGQTYGAASALLTGLALVGVVGSMVFQVRAIRVSREQSSREHHAHLVEMAMVDPVYQRCWGGDPAAHASRDGYRQQVYLNLIVSKWENDYVLGGFRDHALRGTLEYFFRGEAGRKFWAESRIIRPELSESRRAARFCQIMEEEYQKAIASGPHAVDSEEHSSVLPAGRRLISRGSMLTAGAALVLGAIGGVAFETVLRRRR